MSEIKFSDGIPDRKEDYNAIVYPEALLNKNLGGIMSDAFYYLKCRIFRLYNFALFESDNFLNDYGIIANEVVSAKHDQEINFSEYQILSSDLIIVFNLCVGRKAILHV